MSDPHPTKAQTKVISEVVAPAKLPDPETSWPPAWSDWPLDQLNGAPATESQRRRAYVDGRRMTQEEFRVLCLRDRDGEERWPEGTVLL
jgi:hypothetical protein